MKKTFFILFTLVSAFASAQGNANAVLRQQTFGVYSSVSDLSSVQLDSNTLAVFGNGYMLTRQEFELDYHSSGADSAGIPKTKYLNTLIAAYQWCFEAMDQQLDTSMAFQLSFLKHKQEIITPYLNEGKTRVEAEALPEVKYALRLYYSEELGRRLKHKEIWSQMTDENLKPFFYAHPELYQGQPYEISKTKVVHDYQKELESGLTTRMQGKFPYKMNTELQKKL